MSSRQTISKCLCELSSIGSTYFILFLELEFQFIVGSHFCLKQYISYEQYDCFSAQSSRKELVTDIEDLKKKIAGTE